MEDRELLELAAKAAGMSGTCVDYDDRLVFLEDGKPASVEWNPLTDDGDALRLAVKLELAPSIFTTAGLTICTATNRPMSEVNIEEEHNGADPYAATRRAITRAAASIGKERT